MGLGLTSGSDRLDIRLQFGVRNSPDQSTQVAARQILSVLPSGLSRLTDLAQGQRCTFQRHVISEFKQLTGRFLLNPFGSVVKPLDHKLDELLSSIWTSLKIACANLPYKLHVASRSRKVRHTANFLSLSRSLDTATSS